MKKKKLFYEHKQKRAEEQPNRLYIQNFTNL